MTRLMWTPASSSPAWTCKETTVDVWIVTFDDGDYYCEGNHWLGPFATAELAQLAI